MAVETEILVSEVGTEDPIINSGAIGKEGGLGTIPKGRSIVHNIFDNQNTDFLSFDIETAGEIAGIVQISAEILLGVGQGNPRSVCCGVFSYQK